MNKIKILPIEVYSKIAAGEVVDRPSSIVRELIDNSIDAGATEIIIKIEKGGIKKISISDNGNGIDKYDLPTALSMHATSKIEKVDDLLNLYTMGFRGEALYSIQSVSKISIISNVDSTGKMSGYMITNFSDKPNEIKSVAFKKGTKVEVEDIFYNIPARKKFLKSEISEWNSIKKVVITKALSSLNIVYRLYHNEDLIFSTKGNDNFSETFFSIFKNETHFEIFNYSKKINDDIKINLYHSADDVFFSDRKYMNLFVNNRPIMASFFYSSVDKGIRNYISPGRYPLIYIYIDINPKLIDINIHPAKKEIKFINQNDIFTAIQSTIAEAYSKILNRNIIENKKEDYKHDFKTNNLDFYSHDDDSVKTYFNEVINKDLTLKPKRSDMIQQNYDILGVCFDTFVVVEKKDRILFIDQHAASEAIIYFRKKEKYEKSKDIEKLLIPAVFDINENIDDIENKIKLLNSNGFLIEKQEGATYVLRELPGILLSKKDYNQVIDIIIQFLQNYKKFDDNIINAILIEASCKEAIKKGYKLTLLETAEIVDEYFKLGITNCPHGRPSHFELSLDNLEKIFQRKK